MKMENDELPTVESTSLQQERKVKISIEDDFGRTQTIVITRLSPPMLMDNILELEL